MKAGQMEVLTLLRTTAQIRTQSLLLSRPIALHCGSLVLSCGRDRGAPHKKDQALQLLLVLSSKGPTPSFYEAPLSLLPCIRFPPPSCLHLCWLGSATAGSSQAPSKC